MTNNEHQDGLRRAAVVRIYDVADDTVIVGRDGSAHKLSGDSARLARAVLTFCHSARSRPQILAHIEELSGAPLSDSGVVDELLALLVGLEVLVPSDTERAVPPRRGQVHARVVLGITGAAAAMHAPALVQRLHRQGFDVRIAATDSALRFVRVESLEALVHEPVVRALFSEDRRLPVPHINLAQWADVVLICPATGTTISRLATGDYSSVVSAIALATTAPIVVVPSMNPQMYAAPAVQRNVELLSDDGMFVVHPATGHELADAPHHRVPIVGPAPPHGVVVQLLSTILRHDNSALDRAPRDAAEWDRIYRTRPPEQLPWAQADIDDDVAQVLQREAPEASVLDIGTGLGQIAIAAALRGHRVVATDVSSTALRCAHERAGGLPIVWLEDDITASRIHGAFDVVIDRGCLHLLPNERLGDYAAAVARLTRNGGTLVLKTHAPSEGASRNTTPYTAEPIEALLGEAFELVSEQPSTLPGPGDAPAARLFVLRRRVAAL